MDVFAAFAKLDREGKKKLAKKIMAESASFPHELVQIPINPLLFNEVSQSPVEVWRSRGFIVQVFDINSHWFHLKINRNAFTLQYDRFLDGITWERIMQLKAEIGRGALEAVEIFPSDKDSVDSKLRHIWLRKTGSIIDDWGIGWKSSEIYKPANSVDQSSIDQLQILMGVAVNPAQHQSETPETVQLAV